MIETSTHRRAAKEDLARMKSFLEDNGLPVEGIESCLENFVIAEDKDGKWVGLAGLEVYGECGLLRSVAVDRRFRLQGHGRKLVDSVLTNARAQGVRMIYLLTETASSFFQRLGFEIVGRSDLDAAVRASPEFTGVCCESAVAMRKQIA